mmetsp:Transcript_35785/g.113041  ORF Transcript_35785/g.113041 Transcript_35785/m.113041 type:complete len:240 (+) Transcript_35785:115-834(+)
MAMAGAGAALRAPSLPFAGLRSLLCRQPLLPAPPLSRLRPPGAAALAGGGSDAPTPPQGEGVLRVGGGIGMKKTAVQRMSAPVQEQEPSRGPKPPPCAKCGLTGFVECKVCKGSGKMPATGFAKKNRVDMKRVEGSKWTARERTLGWRHFEVRGKKKVGKVVFVEVVSTCDPDKRLWISTAVLKDKSAWAPGWLQKGELAALNEGTAEGGTCGLCRGEGTCPCPKCEKRDRKNNMFIEV